MPIIVLPMLERIFLPSSYLATAFADRFKFPLFKSGGFSLDFDDMDDVRDAAESGVNLLSLVDLAAFFSSPGLWAGMVVCGLLITAAIYLRRYRDET
jgi:hypothetical protein